MERKQNKIMQALEAFRVELSSMRDARKAVDLYQAFDRLYLDYQEGHIDEAEAESRLNSLRSMKSSNEVANEELRVSRHSNSLRQQVLARNHKNLAERMLAMPRGTWDRSHVEVVQQAISVLAKNDADHISLELQKRLSDSVWAANYELADSIQTIDEQRNAMTDMLNALVSHEAEIGYQSDEAQRIVANDVKKQAIDAAVSKAQTDALRQQIENAQKAAQKLDVSEKYVAKLEEDYAAQQNALRAAGQSAETREAVKRAVESIHHASRELVAAEFTKLRAIQANLAKQLATNNDPQTKEIAQATFGALAHDFDASDASLLANNVDTLKSLAKSMNDTDALKQLNEVAQHARSAQALAQFNVADAEIENDDKSGALLEARMMYEQNRMKYEQQARYADHAADMLKALDNSASIPDYSARKHQNAPKLNDMAPSKALRDATQALKYVRSLAQSVQSNDVGLYAPYAGAEMNKNMEAALKLADSSTPMPTAIPTIQSKRARRSNQLMADVRQVAYMPSVRSEMGFNATRYKMIDEMAERPLFKRVKFDHNNKEANELLPALYQAAGIRMKKADTPLRKSNGMMDLNTSNFEIMKIIESQFDSSMKIRDDFQSLANGPEQSRENADTPVGRATAVISDWIDNRHNNHRNYTDTQSLVRSGKMGAREVSTSLRSEGMVLPKSVQEKLTPFLGFDISNIKIYTGPISAMASAAMGAQAFTLGKSIFFGEKKFDFNSPEGLALLAHELTHTTHFNSGDSVNAKEEAAESMEARVLKAFGGAEKSLALESNCKNCKPTSTSSNVVAPHSVGARPSYNVEEVFDRVADGIVEKMIEAMNEEKQRNGV